MNRLNVVLRRLRRIYAAGVHPSDRTGASQLSGQAPPAHQNNQLSFLSEYDSIDIKKVTIKSKHENGFLLNLQANGIFEVTKNAYDLAATEICNVVRKVIA